MNRFLKFIRISLGLFVLFLILYAVKCFVAKPAPDHPYFKPNGFLVIAHRGGRSLGPESTLYTFRRAVELGVDVLEIDLHSTKDGELVILHDATLERTTNATGTARNYTLAELKKFDAAYHWSPQNSRVYPLRDKQIKIPTLAEVFETFSETRLNIEIKESQPDVLPALCQLIRDYHMSKKVMVASFDADVLKEFRSLCPEVATSAGASEATFFYALQKMHLEAAYSPEVNALQVPVAYGDLEVVNKRFLEAAHKRNLRVHVWTVNNRDSMKRLLKLGVDGIMTDYPDRLIELLKNQ
ncbi:MAG: glycerophosphodiester phosphodiesterase [Desulfobacterales bacterium]|nr:glycerophosphodiester phosphodiesterase [Deltaproteobacteria bacterium]NNL77261.1 glycerophosphodiester phosphodiesterase [Desulfobacterales bacterium]